MTDPVSPPFSEEQRHRLITDIMHWKTELELDQEFPPEEFQKYVDMLQTKDGTELKQMWEETVGEWLASRNDLDRGVELSPPTSVGAHKSLVGPDPEPTPTKQVPFTEWLKVQFEKLVTGGNTDYGFVVNVDVATDTHNTGHPT